MVKKAEFTTIKLRVIPGFVEVGGAFLQDTVLCNIEHPHLLHKIKVEKTSDCIFSHDFPIFSNFFAYIKLKLNIIS